MRGPGRLAKEGCRMQESFRIRMRPLSAVIVLLVLIVPSFAFVPWEMGGDSGMAEAKTGSRAIDLTPLDLATPHDEDENVGSLVPDNAIPTGTTTIQADIKNIGDTAAVGAVNVVFNLETGAPVTKWSDDMEHGVNGWTTSDLTASRVHWHFTNQNKHGASGYSLVSSYTSGPLSGQYGNNWEETVAMKNCVNVPISPPAEPYVQFWNFTNTQSQADGGYLQMQIGLGPWVDIIPINPFPPPTLSYQTSINSKTSVLSNGKGAFTGAFNWFQTQQFPLWQQQKGQVNGTCIKFRFWFASDGSNNGAYYGWNVDDFTFNNGNGGGWTDTMNNPAQNNWTFTNELAIDASNGFHQLANTGYNTTTKKQDNTGWWVGNTTKGSYINGTDSVLVSPGIPLTGGGFEEARFTYWQKYNMTIDPGGSGANDGGWVELSTNGGTTWNLIQPMFDQNKNNDTTNYPGYLDSSSDYGKIGVFNGNASWHKMAFDMTPYMGQTVKIRFHFWSNYDNRLDQGWFIDNAQVKVWHFVTAAGSPVTASVAGVNIGQKTIAQVSYDFATETDYRVRVVVPADGNNANNEIHFVVRVKNIRNFGVNAPPSTRTKTVNHGATAKFWLNITNTGNLPDNYTLAMTGQPSSWNVTLNPTRITNLRPGDPPYQVLITVQTAVGEGPMAYPDNTKQSKIYPLTLTVTSELQVGLKNSTAWAVIVTNTKPTVSFLLENMQGKVYTPLEITQPLFNDPDKEDKSSLTFIWDWGDGTPLQNTTTWPVDHTYTRSKSATNPYLVKLKAFDGLATSDVTSMNVTMLNVPPTAKFQIETNAVNNTYAAGDPVVFNATAPQLSKDENPLTLTFSWDYGDGNTGKGAKVNHTYEKGGIKDVVLTVMDEEDMLAYTDKNISINTPPVPVITSPIDGTEFTLGQDIEFNASKTTDNEQTKPTDLEFRWNSNRAGDIGNQLVFHKTFTSKDDIGVHMITLTVNDHKARGIASVTRQISIVAKPQHTPVLEKLVNKAAVVPTEGYMSSTQQFVFTVLYKDQDNDRPSFVNVSVDPGTTAVRNYPMAQADLTEKDFTAGVEYTVKVAATSIGADQVHTFRFEAADERNTTVIVKTQDFTGLRITREKLVGNLALGTAGTPGYIQAGQVAFARVRYVGRQDLDPFTISVLAPPSASPPLVNGKPLLAIGLNVTFTPSVAQGMWDWANLSFRYGYDTFKAQRESINLTSIMLFRLDNGVWTKINADNSEDSMVVSLNLLLPKNVTGTSITYGLFGTAKEAGGCVGSKCNVKHQTNWGQIALVAIIVVVLVAIVVGILYMTRRKKAPEKKWGGKGAIDLKIDVVSGKGTDESAVKPMGKEEGGETGAVPMETTTGESVAIYRPASATAPAGESDIESVGGENVAVYKPGGGAATSPDEEATSPEAPQAERVWTPPPATEGEGETQTPVEEAAPEEPAPEPKPTSKKASDDDLLNEILGDENK